MENMVVRLNEKNIELNQKLETLPEYFECPVCMMIRSNIFECKHCKTKACEHCLKEFTKKELSQNPNLANQQKFKCTICLKIDVQKQMQRYLFNLL